MGLGLVFAVLLDATLIRGVLLPATMKLLGDCNSWLPGSMSWMPQVQHQGESEVTPAHA
jgi:RND superfamily putative drug exporter